MIVAQVIEGEDFHEARFATVPRVGDEIQSELFGVCVVRRVRHLANDLPVCHEVELTVDRVES